MTNKGNIVHGTVKIATCQLCNSSIPFFEFEVETDIGSVGLCSAAQCNSLSVVIAEITMDEWRELASGKLSYLPCRLSDAIGMKDLNILHIKRVDRSPEPAMGIPFSEYRKLYKPPVVIYSCPCCDAGEVIETQELLVSEFEEMGGSIVAMGALVLGR